MRTDILEYLQQEIYTRCKQPTNRFGMGCYYHIEAVVKNGELLAERYGADKEIVIIAAWLHDIASVTDYSLYEKHHIHGAAMAYEILRKFDYEEEKIARVQACIRNHRGSLCLRRTSPEELCVADADAIAHFDSAPSLLYMAYVKKKMDIEEGKEFVKNKLTRSFCKLSSDSRQFYQTKYQQVMSTLG